jgi:acetylornithine/N-succinyldiaminopimelate aminotransferase
VGEYLKEKLLNINGVVDVRGYGLMLGIEFKPEYSSVRNQLLFESHIFTGGAKNNIMRLLPPLSITKEEIDIFIDELIKKLN